MRTIFEIIVHCSASDLPQHDNVETIRKWHLERDFNDIGYHNVITKDGIEFGRPIEKSGAHCLGRNSHSIGICLTGEKYFSEKQFKWLKDLLRFYMTVFKIDKENIHPHNKFNKHKTCPNFDLNEILADL